MLELFADRYWYLLGHHHFFTNNRLVCCGPFGPLESNSTVKLLPSAAITHLRVTCCVIVCPSGVSTVMSSTESNPLPSADHFAVLFPLPTISFRFWVKSTSLPLMV